MDREALANRTLHKPIMAKGQKISDLYGHPVECALCHYTNPRYYSYNFQYHFDAVMCALEAENPSPMMLVGTATSMTGRSTWFFYVHNIFTDASLPYEANTWRGNTQEFVDRGKKVLKALKGGTKWTDERVWGKPWIAAVHRPGTDAISFSQTKWGALASCMYWMEKQESKGFRIDLDFDAADLTKGNVVTPVLSPLTMITDLVDRVNKASTTESRIRRLKEVDEVLDKVEVLKHARTDLAAKLIL